MKHHTMKMYSMSYKKREYLSQLISRVIFMSVLLSCAQLNAHEISCDGHYHVDGIGEIASNTGHFEISACIVDQKTGEAEGHVSFDGKITHSKQHNELVGGLMTFSGEVHKLSIAGSHANYEAVGIATICDALGDCRDYVNTSLFPTGSKVKDTRTPRTTATKPTITDDFNIAIKLSDKEIVAATGFVNEGYISVVAP